MATSRDFEKLWKQYQDEVQSSGKSIVTYCQENGIVYSQFERWYKKRGSSQDKQPMLVPVEVIMNNIAQKGMNRRAPTIVLYGILALLVCLVFVLIYTALYLK